MATLSSSTRSTKHVLASATAGPFLIGYRLFDDDTVEVYVNGTRRYDWSLSSSYSNGYDDNASITFSAALEIGDEIIIETLLTPDRALDYTPGDPDLTEKMNIELGRVWSTLSDHDREIKRSVRTLDVQQAKLDLDPGQFLLVGDGGLIGGGSMGDPGSIALSSYSETLLALTTKGGWAAELNLPRDAASATALAAKGNGTIGTLGGYLYEVDSSAASTGSATNDLSVDGLIPHGPVYPQHFGAVGDGATDDTSAFQAMLTYAGGKPVQIVIPSATYSLDAQLTMTTTAPLSIRGAGMGTAVLKWESTSGSAGIDITANAGAYPITVENLAFKTELAASGTGLTLDFAGQIPGATVMPRTKDRARIKDLTFYGSTNVTTDGWLGGVDIISAVGVVISGCHFEGKANAGSTAADSSFAFRFSGSGSPVQNVVENCTVYWADDAVYVDDTEGVFVTECNFVAVEDGVDFRTTTATEPQLQVSDCHMNVYVSCVRASGLKQFNIHDNLFYSRTNATGTPILVDMYAVDCENGRIAGNLFQDNATGNPSTGIRWAGTAGYIERNTFSSCNLAIQLTSDADNTRVGINEYRNCATEITDAAAANTNAFEWFPFFTGDLDTIGTGGAAVYGPQTHVCDATSAPTNGPAAVAIGTGHVITRGYSTNAGSQVLYPPGARIWARKKSAGTWGAWEEYEPAP